MLAIVALAASEDAGEWTLQLSSLHDHIVDQAGTQFDALLVCLFDSYRDGQTSRSAVSCTFRQLLFGHNKYALLLPPSAATQHSSA